MWLDICSTLSSSKLKMDFLTWRSLSFGDPVKVSSESDRIGTEKNARKTGESSKGFCYKEEKRNGIGDEGNKRGFSRLTCAHCYI